MTDDPASRDGSKLDDEFEPMRRDRGFVFRLVAALIVGLMAAAFVGWKIKSAASGCGAGLIRPGGSVVAP